MRHKLRRNGRACSSRAAIGGALPGELLAVGFEPEAFWDHKHLEQTEQTLCQQRQQGRRDGTFEDQRDIVQPDAGQYRLAVTSSPDECAERGRANIDHGGSLNPDNTDRAAMGSSTSRRQARRGKPKALADSRMGSGMSFNPE